MTSEVHERPTIGERYGSATDAKNLRVGEKSGPADILMAAAMQPHHLGALLFRLQREYDAVRSEIEAADARARALELQARRTEKAGDDGPGLAEAIRRRGAGEVLMARVLILTRLKTLHEAKQAIGSYAIVMATKHRFMKPNDIVLKLAGRVLDVHLDPLCHVCDGTGWVVGGYETAEKPKQCSACKGTGHRRDTITKADEQWFAFLLLGDLQREMAAAAGAMGRKLRKGD